MKNKILVIVLLTIIGGLVVWSLSKSDKLAGPNNVVPQPQDKQIIDDKTGELKLYQNKEIGISFRYPDIFRRVDMGVHSGETGRRFTGVLEFAPNQLISFGGTTKDYSASRGGSITDTHGYEKQGEKYAIKFIWGNQEVTPGELWPVNSGKDQAIVIRNMEIEQVLSRESVAAFVNIPNSPFPGIVFEMTPVSPDKSVNEKQVEILRQIVSSITFEK
ncbi:MAG: hypothetical protein Q8Q94_01050 [bacterium]|nr:hypothetical protein [bacterium]